MCTLFLAGSQWPMRHRCQVALEEATQPRHTQMNHSITMKYKTSHWLISLCESFLIPSGSLYILGDHFFILAYHAAFNRVYAECVIPHSISISQHNREDVYCWKKGSSIHLFDEIIIGKYSLSNYLLWYLIGGGMLPSGSVHPVSHRQR